MELSQFLNSLRDPSGVPFYPIVFQFLMVLTFTLHIMAINVVVGGLFVAIWEAWKGGPFGKRLARALGKVSTMTLSIGIVLGVAPLLFVQVIYDPFWYASNTMSAIWTMIFLVLVCTAFYSSYGFYLGNRKNAENGNLKLFWAYVGVASLVLSGLIIHMLSMEALLPEQWFKWLVEADGSLLTGGARFHGVSLGRISHYLLASFAVTGAFLMLYAWYFSPRKDFEKDYLDYVAKKGANLALYGTLFAAAAGFWWVGTIPSFLEFLKNPIFLLSIFVALFLLLYLAQASTMPVENAINVAILMFITIFVMSYAREILRMDYVGAFDYSIFAYKLKIDWGSTTLFFGTFVMGLVVLYFPIISAFKAGRAEPGTVVTISPKIGNLANVLLIAWFVFVAGLGLFISIKNGTLF